MKKNVLVIVGSGGMGEVIARRQGAGMQVVLADFSEAVLARVAEPMTADGFDVTTTVVDVSDRESLAKVARLASDLGDITQFVHTAGISPTQATAARGLEVNARGVVDSLDVFGRVIADGGAGVVIASMAGSLAIGALPAEVERSLRTAASSDLLENRALSSITDSGVAYSLAKRANQLRVEYASVEWGQRGARINSVSPGVISTEHGQRELNSEESGGSMRRMIQGSGAGRIGTPYDIADAVSFLLSPAASFITGTDLLVDGGVVAAVRSGHIEVRSL